MAIDYTSLVWANALYVFGMIGSNGDYRSARVYLINTWVDYWKVFAFVEFVKEVKKQKNHFGTQFTLQWTKYRKI
jgi:hypothetical protein